jgi:hypothetical protein
MNILDALDDPQLFGGAVRNPSTFEAWRAFLACLFDLRLPDHLMRVASECTGRSEPPRGHFHEGWLICGRRAGKSFVPCGPHGVYPIRSDPRLVVALLAWIRR